LGIQYNSAGTLARRLPKANREAVGYLICLLARLSNFNQNTKLAMTEVALSMENSISMA
jgi:hypothetical protein